MVKARLNTAHVTYKLTEGGEPSIDYKRHQNEYISENNQRWMKKRKMIPFEVESFRKPHLGENTEKLSMKERCNKT